MSNYALRLPESLMKAARRLAKKEKTSMNQLFAIAIAEKVSAIETEKYFKDRGRKADLKAYRRVLAKIPAHKPLPGDELPRRAD
ncbi:MAG: hypothetical protein JOZ83_07865 [Silvibacterium sp.]|nr:hypothetical protein [Silvibacterium sp.]